jgi:lipopolysaccharide transport system permease protein
MLTTPTPSTKIISGRKEQVWQYANPLKMFQNLWTYRELIGQFTKRQILQKYRGSYLGIFWSLATPLAILLVYTFVFSVIFKARWDAAITDSHAEFALTLFAGLIAFNIFSESNLAASNLSVSQPNYVKKVIYPLEILPVSTVGAAIIHSLFSGIILISGIRIMM